MIKMVHFRGSIQYISYKLDKFCHPFSKHIASEVDEIFILHSVSGKHCYLP